MKNNELVTVQTKHLSSDEYEILLKVELRQKTEQLIEKKVINKLQRQVLIEKALKQLLKKNNKRETEEITHEEVKSILQKQIKNLEAGNIKLIEEIKNLSKCYSNLKNF